MDGTAKVGLVIGKFYPPHRGHKYLIEFAESNCDKVYVIVAWKGSETIPGLQRVEWIKEIHPNVTVLNIKCDHIDDDDSKTWAEVVDSMMWEHPTHVFTSEDYGWAFSAYLKSVHVLVDKERVTVPISATMVRSNPLKYWEQLEPCVRTHFLKRIAIVGAESTGTTTLARKLADHNHTAWVPEYGRMFWEGLPDSIKKDGEWTTGDFVHIARMQNQMEDAIARTANRMLFCDTTSLATAVFQQLYMGKSTKEVLDVSKFRKYDLYVVTYPDIPYEQDGTRQVNDNRRTMHEWFINILEQKGLKYIVVKGSVEDRVKAVENALN